MNRLFLSKLKHITFAFKKYSTKCFFKEDYTVNPLCSLFVTSAYNLKIRPLDVHKYPNCDKIIVSLFSDNSKPKANIICIEDQTIFNIFGESQGNEIIECFIEAPIKASINIIAHKNGSIDIQKFHGDQIILCSEDGNIISDSCQNSKIDVRSTKGNITTLGTLHASEIYVESKKANININHLQALKATVITEKGDIKIKSSYCDDTNIRTNTGKLYLDNMHKKCSVKILENGLLQMTGFDGVLNASLTAGDVDIQISKLYEQSSIEAKQKGSILLRLSEWIQNNTKIKTECQQLKVSDDVILSLMNENNCPVLTPKNSQYTSELQINTKLSNINIEGASWSDMLKLKGIKFSE